MYHALLRSFWSHLVYSGLNPGLAPLIITIIAFALVLLVQFDEVFTKETRQLSSAMGILCISINLWFFALGWPIEYGASVIVSGGLILAVQAILCYVGYDTVTAKR